MKCPECHVGKVRPKRERWESPQLVVRYFVCWRCGCHFITQEQVLHAGDAQSAARFKDELMAPPPHDPTLRDRLRVAVGKL